MAISGHRSEASFRNYIGYPSRKQQRTRSYILCDVLSGRQHQSEQPRFTLLSSRTIVMFLRIRLSFIHKTQAWSSVLLVVMLKKLACFYEQLNHFSLSTIAYCELRWFDIFDSFSFVQPIRSLNILCVFMLCKSTAQGSGSFLPIYFNLKILHLFMFH